MKRTAAAGGKANWFCAMTGTVAGAAGVDGALEELTQQRQSSQQQAGFAFTETPPLTRPLTAKVWATMSSRLNTMAANCFTARLELFLGRSFGLGGGFLLRHGLVHLLQVNGRLLVEFLFAALAAELDLLAFVDKGV